MSLSYESSGVRYDQLDAFKRACQKAARTTAGVLADHGYAEPATTRGESAYLIEAADHFLAHVEEGLGTKNLVADAVYAATGKCFYREISIETVATMVNDLVTCGALPISVAMHAAVGDSGWFADETRTNALVAGFAEGCRAAGAVWGGGETPTLGGIVEPEAIVLAGTLPAARANQTFNVGAAEYTTLREDFQAVFDAAGHNRTIRSLPVAPAIWTLRLLEKYKLSPLYPWIYETVTEDSFVSIDRARTDLGWTPTWSNKAALVRNYDWYCNNVDRLGAAGVTHRVPWKQGALALAKVAFPRRAAR